MYQFENFAGLMAMNGHGPYVWTAYGISVAVMLWLGLAPLRRKRLLLRELKARLDRERNS